MDVSPDHEPTLIKRGTDVHLNHPVTAQRGTHDSRPARWESWTPHPFVPRKDDEGAESRPGDRGSPRPQATSATHQAVGPGTPRVKLRLARGARAVPPKLRLARGLDTPSGETLPRSRPSRACGPSGFQPGHPSSRTPPRSRAIRTLKLIPVSLECAPSGGSPLRSGSRGFATPAPTPPTEALNALTHRGRPG
jgi:hypothetical protein